MVTSDIGSRTWHPRFPNSRLENSDLGLLLTAFRFQLASRWRPMNLSVCRHTGLSPLPCRYPKKLSSPFLAAEATRTSHAFAPGFPDPACPSPIWPIRQDFDRSSSEAKGLNPGPDKRLACCKFLWLSRRQ